MPFSSITSRGDFARRYLDRCLDVDGFFVLKSSVPFKIGETFGGAASPLMGNVSAHMIVLGISSSAECQDQAKRIANVTLRPVDLRAKYYYKIAPDPKRGKYVPHFQPLRDGSILSPMKPGKII